MKILGLIGLLGLMGRMGLMASPQTSDLDLRVAQVPPLRISEHVVDCQGLRVAVSGVTDVVALTNAASVDFSGLTALADDPYNPCVLISGVPVLNGDASALFAAVAGYGGNSLIIRASGCGIRSAATLSIYAANCTFDLSNNQIPSLDLSGAPIVFSPGTVFDFENNPALTTLVPGDGTTTGIVTWSGTFVSFQGCALTQASEDAFLAACVAAETASPGQGGTLDMSGGTNAAPDATGAGSIATLVAAGWTLMTN